MKVSGFTFLKNGQMLGYPFVESIKSVLPIVDEFVVALGPCEDDSEAMLKAIGDPKVRIINTTWNEGIRNDLRVKGYVYGQQKSIALFNCTGDWAFYLEGNEIVHEDDLPVIHASMEKHLDNDRVEALAFDYLHFYGNGNTIAWSPHWYRRETRILRNTIPAWGPKGLFFVVLDTVKRSRYPRAAHTGGRIFHYGWVRSEEQFNTKCNQVGKFWRDRTTSVQYNAIDANTLRPFTGTHPAAIRNWLPTAGGMFEPDPNYVLTRRDRRYRLQMKLERLLGLDFSKKHFRTVK